MEERDQSRVHSFGPYTLCPTERVLRYLGQPVVLAPKTLDLLFALTSAIGQVISKHDLIEHLWPDSYVDEANLTQNIYVLRQLFKQHNSGIVIENIPKRGYRLTPQPVSAAALDTVLCASVEPRSASNIWAALRTLKSDARLWGLCTLALIFIGGAFFATHRTTRTVPSLSGSALAHYLLGRSYQDDGSAAHLRLAAELFARVVSENPQNASGYAALAESKASLAYYAPSAAQQAALQATAIGLAREAVSKDSHSADAYAALGGVEFSIAHDEQPAAADFQKALALNPNQPEALVWYGTLLMNAGRVETARRMFGRALGISAQSPGTAASLAWSDFVAGDSVGAITLSKHMLTIGQLPSLARITLANAYLASRDYRDATSVIDTLASHAQTRYQGMALRVRLAALTGRTDAATREVRWLDAVVDTRKSDGWDAASIAAAYLAVRDSPHAFAWLARVDLWERRLIVRDPRFSALVGDPHFQAWAKS
ncbi:MAG: winged helix-turn-helix domain-containing protein [Candidatus Eremiobacteraeota bacterium]|nr:winged helix-turn-helix domain-containing protein [Candidatus Eremiobacteraeota bacterium]